MTTPTFAGKLRFPIKGQAALPKWQRDAIKRGMESLEGPPESLRFKCRIAEDARANFADVRLADGTHLYWNPRQRGGEPQFYKDHKGLPHLTITLTDDDGQSYSVQWVGDAVPLAMQETAVKHDMGLQVGHRVVSLDWAQASVTPVARKAPVRREGRNYRAEEASRKAQREAGVAPKTRARRVCERLTAADLS